MTASTWLIIAIILFTLAGALFIAAVIMFFVMNIPGIIGDLSGRTLAKGIQNIRSANAYANSKSARAANRRNNPNRQFSIGNEYSKEKGYTLTSLAHASRRLDRNTVRGAKVPPKTSPGGTSESLGTPPAANNFTGSPKNNIPRKETSYPQDNYAPVNNAGYVQNSAPSNVYSTRETSVLNTANDEYTQATTVLNNANDEYTQATTVLNNANNEYTQATTVLNNANDKYTQATTVLENSDNGYSRTNMIQNDSYNQYNQATTVLGGEDNQNDLILDSYYNEYTQGTTVLSNSPNGSSAAASNEEFFASQHKKPASDLPLGFRVVRKVSVTHCNEVL